MFTALNDILGYVLIFVLLPLGLWLSVKSGFIQLRFFSHAWRLLSRGSVANKNQLTGFQALAFSVAGRVGAGNVAGVAVAISLGGPGALFWMWVVGILGMATSVVECSLAQLYKRRKNDGSFRGGPSYYIAYGYGSKKLSVLFSGLLFVTFGFGFPALQSYTMANSLQSAFSIPLWLTAVLLPPLLAVIIFGGLKRIAAFSQAIVPLMAVAYFAVALFVIVRNFDALPSVLLMIFNDAFGFSSAVGGGVGSAILFGVRRGLFSNEAGLGSAPNVAATASAAHPVSQGLIQGLSVFIDTIVLCSCTGFIILLADINWQSGVDGVTLTQLALAQHVGIWGEIFVSLILSLFTLTSIIYCYFLGETSLSHLTGNSKSMLWGFRLLSLLLVAWGVIEDLTTVFAFANVTMSLLALLNLAALILLRKIGLRLLNDYKSQYQKGNSQPSLSVADYLDLNVDENAWSNISMVPHSRPEQQSVT